jgi:5-methylcytosine-specific restriction endonuclease McrA
MRKTEEEKQATARARRARWVAANPERRKAQNAVNNAKNKEQKRARRAEMYRENPTPLLEYGKAYYQANKEKIMQRRRMNPEVRRAANAKRRAAKRGAAGGYTAADVRALMKLQRGKCPACASDLCDGYHIDHVMPLALGGANDKSNLQLLCPPCNQSKGALHPIEHAQRIGRLL